MIKNAIKTIIEFENTRKIIDKFSHDIVIDGATIIENKIKILVVKPRWCPTLVYKFVIKYFIAVEIDQNK